MGLLSTGNSVFGLVQLRDLSLVPNPPARIKAFKWRFTLSEFKLYSKTFLIKQFRGSENHEVSTSRDELA
jgi:hypothetical protein